MRATSALILSCLLCLSFSIEAQLVESNQNKDASFGAQRDTVKALTHLFQRKRHGTRIKAIALGILADVLIIKTWPHPPSMSHGTMQPVGPAPQTPVASSSAVPTIHYVFVGVSTALCVEIISQLRYGERKLNILLEEYDAGKPIPPRIKSKLTAKDFD